jgi:hypothetical protein
MPRSIRSLLIGLALLAGVSACQPAPQRLSQATSPAPAGWPGNLRWDLVPRWIAWANDKATISWPPNDGCAAAPVAEALPAGTLIDRFGSEGGSFFSPKGESYRSRAVPYVCQAMEYRVYQVLKTLPVKACKAAPWFGEPGGAEQFQTADPAFKLEASSTIRVVTFVPPGASPAPQCGP